MFNLAATRKLPSINSDLRLFLPFSSNGGRALAGGCVHPFGMYHAVFGTDRFKLVLPAVLTVWLSV